MRWTVPAMYRQRTVTSGGGDEDQGATVPGVTAAGSHAGSHPDGQPSGTSDLPEQRAGKALEVTD